MKIALSSIILAGIFCGCSLWTTDAPTDNEAEYESVVNTLTKACREGNYISCYNLGYMYENGKGVDQDKDEASELYQKACTNGVVEACDKQQ